MRGGSRGAVLLVGVLGVLVAITLITAALVTEREWRLIPLGEKVGRLETGIQHGLSGLRHWWGHRG